MSPYVTVVSLKEFKDQRFYVDSRQLARLIRAGKSGEEHRLIRVLPLNEHGLPRPIEFDKELGIQIAACHLSLEER